MENLAACIAYIIAYIVEHAPKEHREIAGSASCMCIKGMLGLATAKAFSYYMCPEDLIAWGWRLPFIAGLFIGGVRLYIKQLI